MWASLVLTLAMLAVVTGSEATPAVMVRGPHVVTDAAPGLFTRVRSTERFMIARDRLRRGEYGRVERDRVGPACLVRRRSDSIVSRVGGRFRP